tara:strand:+ start:350 stop:634 length:285 start_codon:yes stop_codon:yes gene_type:complete
MKNLTILYFTLFLSFGNILLSSLHEIEHQHHCSKQQIEAQCNECVLFKNLDNHTTNKFVLEFSPSFITKFHFGRDTFLSSETNLSLKSRAPPLS